MKLRLPVIHTLGVVILGLIIILASAYILNVSRSFTKELAVVNAYEVLLGRVDASASAIALRFDEVTVHELTYRAAALEKRTAQLDPDFISSVRTALVQLTDATDNISALYLDYKNQLALTPDSLDVQVKAVYTSRIINAIDIAREKVGTIEMGLSAYKNEAEAAVEKISFYRFALLLMLLLIFGGLAAFAYFRAGNFEKYKISSEEKIARNALRMETMGRFVEAIANGKYSETIEFEKGDHLAESMVEMKNKLMLSAETDRKRNWATQGMAEIGTLLRDSSSVEQLYFNIIRFCVKYTNSNQGSLFVLNEEGEDGSFLELVSTYAFDKKKFIEKKINLGDGLVGQAVLEGSTVRLTKVPQDYVHITSGLGDAPPTALVIVPLRLNDKVYGVIELASFNQYEPYEIEFLEKSGESVAAAISTAKINENTKSLLEKSQQQTEELRAQEEEMRQNMEELNATQEQMARQMEEAKVVTENLRIRESVFGLTTILSEADLYGTITLANSKLIEVSKYSREELIGKPHNIFRHPDMPKELFKIFWDTIRKGKVFRGIIKNRCKDGSHYWVDATIVPVVNDEGKIIKYIGARYHITDDGCAERLYNKQALMLNLPTLQSTVGQLTYG